jgi:hypothetical protein
VPTLEHNGIIEMFREKPPLTPHLIEKLFHLKLPSHASVKVVEASLDQMIPVELRADLVLELLDGKGEPVLLIVLEVQRDEDPDKKYSWPVYVTVVRAKKRCPAIVLVVAPDEKVATWAAEKIDVGLGLTTTQPLVLGPAIVPHVTDPAEAEQETELAILSAVAHGNQPNGLAVVTAALTALGRLDQEHAAVYFRSSGTRCASPCGGLWRRWSWSDRPKARQLSPRSRNSSSIAASTRAARRRPRRIRHGSSAGTSGLSLQPRWPT